ncbi:MAG: tRNA (adenosine(37)-N6)-threonylcarbamoyltransferase complex transferase subunit TsaD, partial [Acidimicrobiia bacterium]|nr:tRNA (adenosine(37)-N6)-threonylcarbamoyltransferase complex transferase subunit TsaD [Acidimicrobiia bacterium]
MAEKLILAIETSCDETSVAVVENGTRMLSNVVSSQIEIHAPFGGVVPEVASRAHLQTLEPVLDQAMTEAGVSPEELTAVAATNGPGLIGALLIGVTAAKTLALAWNKPYVGVNHLEGHVFAAFLERPDLETPMITMLVSGGHTSIVHVEHRGDYEVVGATIDDAAGEAFDKVARYLGLGYPGGPLIDRMAQSFDGEPIHFPRGLMDGSLDFSFSGMKTAVINYVRKHPETPNDSLAAGFQEAVVDVLTTKCMQAVDHYGVHTACLGGGVAANSALRERFAAECEARGVDALVPARQFCTDNAAMIAAAAHWRL